MNGSKRFQFGRWELNKIMGVAIFLSTSGILTNVTQILTNIDFGRYTTLVMAAWNLLLAIIYHFVQDNSNKQP